MDTMFHLPKTTFIGGKETQLPLKEIVARLERTYCQVHQIYILRNNK